MSTDMTMIIVFIVVGIGLFFMWAATYTQGSQAVEDRLPRIDNYDPSMGVTASMVKSAQSKRRSEYLAYLIYELQLVAGVDRAKAEITFQKIVILLEQEREFKRHQVIMAVYDNLLYALKSANRAGMRLEHHEALMILLVTGGLGQTLNDVQRKELMDTLDLKRLQAENKITFDFNKKLDKWKRERIIDIEKE